MGENERSEWQPQGNRIGWLGDDGSLLLEPGAAFAVAQKVAREQGTGLPIKERTLWKRMSEKGLLASRDKGRGRNTTRATIAGERKTVVHLISGILSLNDPIGPNDPSPGRMGDSGPKERVVYSALGAETTRENGPNPTETGPGGPKGPIGSFSEEGPGGKVERGAHHRLPDGEVCLIDTQASVKDLLAALRDAECVGLDLETTGLGPREHRVRLLTLDTEQGTWTVVCFKVDPSPLFPILAQKKLLIHNALFDLSFLSQMGFEMEEGGEVVDTMLTAQLLGVEETEDKEDT